jgi:CRISPR-associated Csx2 family protein
MTTLVTFIGKRARNELDGFTRYRFPTGLEVRAKLFASAALQWLQAGNRKPARLLMIGTSTSDWDVLMNLVEQHAPEHADEALEWGVRATERRVADSFDDRALRDFESAFSSPLGLRVDLVIAPNEGDAIFEALDARLAPDEQVVLDITHSFRSMPVHAIVALGALRWLKGIELVDILYASLDERGADGVALARSLGGTAALAKSTPALAQLVLADDVGHLGDAFGEPGLRSVLSETQRYESLMQFAKAARPRGQALGQLRKLEAADSGTGAILRALAKKACEALSSLNAGRGSFGLRNRAERAVARRDYMRAVGLANEMLLLKAIELRGFSGDYEQLNKRAREEVYRQSDLAGAPRSGRFAARDNFTTLNYLRNAVMHPDGGIADKGVPRVVDDEDDMRSLLRWSLDFYDFLA